MHACSTALPCPLTPLRSCSPVLLLTYCPVTSRCTSSSCAPLLDPPIHLTRPHRYVPRRAQPNPGLPRPARHGTKRSLPRLAPRHRAPALPIASHPAAPRPTAPHPAAPAHPLSSPPCPPLPALHPRSLTLTSVLASTISSEMMGIRVGSWRVSCGCTWRCSARTSISAPLLVCQFFLTSMPSMIMGITRGTECGLRTLIRIRPAASAASRTVSTWGQGVWQDSMCVPSLLGCSGRHNRVHPVPHLLPHEWYRTGYKVGTAEHRVHLGARGCVWQDSMCVPSLLGCSGR